MASEANMRRTRELAERFNGLCAFGPEIARPDLVIRVRLPDVAQALDQAEARGFDRGRPFASRGKEDKLMAENFCRDCIYVNRAGKSHPSFWECQRTSGRNYVSGEKEFPFCQAVRGRGRCCPDFKPSPVQNCTFTADGTQGVKAPAS